MTSDNERDRPTRGRTVAITPAGIAGTLLLFIVVAVCLRLGFWQLSRLDERRTLNAGIAARLDQDPIGDITRIADTTGISYRVATARGTYDNARHVVLPGRSHQGVPGVHLIMPLRLEGRADAVLINRGWVPAPDAATIDARDFSVSGTVDVRGLVLPFPGRAQSLAQRESNVAADTFTHVLYRIDEAALRAQFPYPLMDVMLQETRTGGARYPTPLDPPPLDQGPHLGYAIQWFSFALIGVIGWFALVLRPRLARPAIPAALGALAFAVAPTDAAAQLRPLDPVEWRIFDDDASFIATIGAGVLLDQPAPLAGTRGTLLEIGTYTLAFRSGRIVGGAIRFEGKDLLKLSDEEIRDVRGKDIAMVFQEPMTSLNPVLTIGRQLTETLQQHLGMTREQADVRAIELLGLVGIAEPERRLKQYPHHLSGGMRQRVMIAMALCCEPKLIIADEPTTALDVTIQAQILELMKDLTRRLGVALIVITHNLGIVARYADRVNVMYAGRIIESGTAHDIYHDPQHPYTLALLKSVPRMDRPRQARLDPVQGQPPDLTRLDNGCAFRPRCGFVATRCAQEIPQLVRVGAEGHLAACWESETVAGSLRRAS